MSEGGTTFDVRVYRTELYRGTEGHHVQGALEGGRQAVEGELPQRRAG
jgi:hypothetical protein